MPGLFEEWDKELESTATTSGSSGGGLFDQWDNELGVDAAAMNTGGVLRQQVDPELEQAFKGAEEKGELGWGEALGGGVTEGAKDVARSHASTWLGMMRGQQKGVVDSLREDGYSDEEIAIYMKGGDLPEREADNPVDWVRSKIQQTGFNRGLHDVAAKQEKATLENSALSDPMMKRDLEFEIRKEKTGGLKGFASDVARVAPQLAGQLATNVAGGPILSALNILSNITGMDYERNLEQGVDPNKAFNAAFWDAVMQAPLEQIGISKITGSLKGVIGKRLKKIVEAGATEGLTEYLQAYPEKFTELFAKNPDAKALAEVEGFVDEVWNKEFQKSAGYQGLVGAVAGGGPVAVSQGMGAGIDLLNKQEEQPKPKATMDAKVVGGLPEVVRVMGGAADPHGFGSHLDPESFPRTFDDTGYTESEVRERTAMPFPDTVDLMGMETPTVTPGQKAKPTVEQPPAPPKDGGYSVEEINAAYEQGQRDAMNAGSPFPDASQTFGGGLPTVVAGQSPAPAPVPTPQPDAGYTEAEINSAYEKEHAAPFPAASDAVGVDRLQDDAFSPIEEDAMPEGVILSSSGKPFKAKGARIAAVARSKRTGETWEPVEYASGKWGIQKAKIQKAEPVDETGAAPFEESVGLPEGEFVAERDPLEVEWEQREQGRSIETQANEAATSEQNDTPQPTEAMKKAGNYKLGHTRVNGLDISIENPAGSERSGKDQDGKPWSVEMQHHYGYIKGTVGKDKDHLDVFLKDGVESQDMESKPVFVVDQKNEDGSFDEHKILMGFDNAQDAEAGYLSNYEEGWQGMGAITAMSPLEFKRWTKKTRKTKMPVAYAEPQQKTAPEKPQIVSKPTETQIDTVAASEEIPGEVRLKADGKPYSKKAINLVVVGKIKKGMNVEPVQLDEEGKKWGWRKIVDEGPKMDQDAQGKIRQSIINAVPDRSYDGMMNHADTLIDEEGFSIDDVYEVISQIDDEVQNEKTSREAGEVQGRVGEEGRSDDPATGGKHSELDQDGSPSGAQADDAQAVEDSQEKSRIEKEEERIRTETLQEDGSYTLDGADALILGSDLSWDEFSDIIDRIEAENLQLEEESHNKTLTNEDVDSPVLKFIYDSPLDGKSLRDWKGLYKSLSKKFGRGFFKARSKGGIPIDEMADMLNERGLFDGTADDLVEFLKDADKLTDNREQYGFESRPTPKAKKAKAESKQEEPKISASPANAKDAPIQDLGEKIGGARKDTAQPLGKRTKKVKEKDKRAAWRKRYIAMENLMEKGTWQLVDTRTNKFLSREKFSSQIEAEEMLPLAVVGVKHSPRMVEKGKWDIIRRVSKYKRVVIKDGFKSREDALRYMAENAADIIETNTRIGEEILVKPEKVYRSGAKRRTGDVEPQAFMDDFGFRAVEFGNWNNQAERQEILNHAYDGLMDLADVIGVPPKALSLNGDLALAFGARGQGLSSAKAHYEGHYGVINLTKLKGAGSLAHEWFHGFDHYLGRLDGKASSEMVKNKKGHKVFDAKPPSNDYASHGFLYKSNAREEVRKAYTKLIKTMMAKAEQYVEDTQNAEKFVGMARDNLRTRLETIRANIAKERAWGRKKRAATEEELVEFDSLVEQLLDGNNLQLATMENKTKKGKSISRFGSWRETNGTLDAMNDILLAVTGRSGFNSKREGALNGVARLMRSYADRIKILDDAKGGDKKTKKVPTDYLMESRKIDEGRPSDYWTTNHEMAARAFSAFVEDKIAQAGNESYFLSYGSDNAFYRLQEIRPFPEGKERDAMNKAFEELFDVLETKETPKGVALFSLSTTDAPAKGMKPKAVELAVAKLQKAAKNVLPLKVVKSFSDLPQHIQDEAKRKGNGYVEAANDGQAVYIVADNVSSRRRAVALWMHEQGVHTGLKELFGIEYRQILNQVYLAAGGKKAFQDIAKRYKLDLNSRIDQMQAAEEYLASLAEKVSEGHVLEGREIPVWRRVVKAIAAWLRKMGVNLKLTDSEIAWIVNESIHATVHGEHQADSETGLSPAVAFALNDDVDPDQEVQVVDLSDVKPLKKVSSKMAKQFVEKWKGVPLEVNVESGKWEVSLRDKGKGELQHPAWSSDFKGRDLSARRKALAALDKVLKGAVLIESSPNKKTKKRPDVETVHRFYVPVSTGQNMALVRIVVYEGKGRPAEIHGVELSDVIIERPRPAALNGGATDEGSQLGSPGRKLAHDGKGRSSNAGFDPKLTIKIRDLLKGVKDVDGKPYLSLGGGKPKSKPVSPQEAVAALKAAMNGQSLPEGGEAVSRTMVAKPSEIVQGIAKGDTNDVIDNMSSGDLTILQEVASLPHWIAKRFPAFDKIYRRQLTRMDERAAVLKESLEEVEDFFTDLTKEEHVELRDLIWEIDGQKLPGMNLDKFIPVQDDKGRDVYENGRIVLEMNPRYYRMYEAWLDKQPVSDKVKKALAALRQSLDRDFLRAYDAMREMAEIDDNTIKEFRSNINHVHNYFPHKRYGAYYVQAVGDNYVAQTENGKWALFNAVDEVISDEFANESTASKHWKDNKSSAVYREHFDAPTKGMASRQAEKKIAELKGEYPDKVTWSKGKNERLPDELYEYPMDTNAMEQVVTAAADKLKDKELAKEIKSNLAEAISDTMKSRGWSAATIGRKGVPGHETEDIQGIIYDYKAGLSGWLTKIQASRDFTQLLGEVNAAKHPREYVYATNYVQNMLRNADKIDRAVGNIKAIAFLWYLGFNIKTAVLNLTQNVIVGIPRLGMDVKGGGFKYVNAAMDTLMEQLTGRATGGRVRTLPEDEMRLLDDLYREDVITEGFLNEIRGRVQGLSVASVSNKVLKWAGMPMAIAERFNRASLALAAYRAARDGKLKKQPGKKMNYEAAKAYAEDIVRDSHFVYGKTNLPQPLRNSTIGRGANPAYTFRTFSHNILSIWNWMLRTQGKEGATAFAKSMVGTMAIGGFTALPFYATLMHLFQWATGDDDDWTEEIRKELPENDMVRDMVTYGLPAGAGFSLGGSVGLETPIASRVEPGATIEESISENLGDIFGIPYDMFIRKPSRVMKALNAGDEWRAFEEIAPTIIKNAMAGYRLSTEGQRSMSGKPINEPGKLGPRKLTETEAWGKMAGFQPISSRKSYDQYRGRQVSKQVRSNKATEFANLYIRALRTKDQDKAAMVVTAWQEWNKEMRNDKKPWMVITKSDLKTRIKARSKGAGVSPRDALRILEQRKAY